MTMQAYLDNIRARTGKSPEDFRKLAAKHDFAKVGDAIAWLKKEFGLGHGHANLIAQLILKPDALKVPKKERLAGHFSGNRAVWQRSFDELATRVRGFGKDVDVSPNRSYINLQRGGKKFGIVQVSAGRLDIGIKLRDLDAEGLEPSGSWNAMVTHRIRIESADKTHPAVYRWLKKAYDATK